MQNRSNALIEFYYAISMSYRNIAAAFPRAPRIDADGLDPNFGKPGVEVLSDELRTALSD